MTIDNYNFANKKAIVRVDFNVPLDENGHITDDTLYSWCSSHSQKNSCRRWKPYHYVAHG